MEQELERVEITKQKGKQLDTNGKYVALTFDDGPSPEITPRVLEILNQFTAKATFFMLGYQVEYYPTIAKQVLMPVMKLQVILITILHFTKFDHESMKQEFQLTSEKIKEVTGITPILFRPPYGAYDDEITTYAERITDVLLFYCLLIH